MKHEPSLRIGLAVCASILFLGAAIAQESVETTDGRELLLFEDGTYRELTEARESDAGNYTRKSMTDLKLDLRELHGERVEVDASLMIVGNLLMLTDPHNAMDTNPVMAEVGDLARDDRRFLIENCGTGCRVTVRGKVTDVNFQSGLRLHGLQR